MGYLSVTTVTCWIWFKQYIYLLDLKFSTNIIIAFVIVLSNEFRDKDILLLKDSDNLSVLIHGRIKLISLVKVLNLINKMTSNTMTLWLMYIGRYGNLILVFT